MDRRAYAPLRLPAYLPRSVCEPLYDFYGYFCNAAWFHTLGYPVFSPLIANDSLLFRTDPFNMQHKKWTNPWDPSITSVESFFDLYGRSEEKYLHCLTELSALLKERIHSPKAAFLTEQFLKDYGNASFHSGLDCTI